ncbi:TolC family protein [Pontiella sp.]|uniref:TolC family protein n=1 Tax=Pontiella sp. TaxID=2837462 RepID=UPI0035695EB1
MNYMNKTTRNALGAEHSRLGGLRALVVKKSVLLVLLLPMVGTAQTNGLSLAEVRAAVLAANPSVREAVQRIAAAEAVLQQAKSAVRPTLSMTGSYGHVDASLHPDIDPVNRYSDSFKQASVGLQANWLLLDGCASRARILAAEHGVQQTRELVDETRRLLILSATVTFRQAQLARENVAIAERDFAFNTNLESDARKRFEAGAAPESEVLNFTIRALQAESAALQARLEYNTARVVLAELMALPEDRLSDALPIAEIDFSAPEPVPSMDGVLKSALARRPDYKALTAGRLALAESVKAAKGELAPKVALVGDVNYVDRHGYTVAGQHGNYDSFVGLAASWDLFTGQREQNAVKQAQAEMRALEERQESLRLSIRSALRQRIAEAETARAVYERQKQIHELTVKVRDSVEKSYKAGLAPITRLNEAQTDLVRARGGYSSSYIAYRLILNQLDIETGRVLETL